jgi:hypothetical protein
MRLVNFLTIVKEDSSDDTGTFVGARLTRDSVKDLSRWMKDEGIKKKVPNSKLHVTVILDKEKSFDHQPIKYDPPLEIDSTTYRLERFDTKDGKGALVLVFSSPEFEKRHHDAKDEHSIHWDYLYYQPHITLSYDNDQNIEDIRKPQFPVYIDKEYVEENS